MIVPNADVPADFWQAVDHYHHLLRLDHWRIEVKLWDDIPNCPGGTEGNAAIQAQYFTALLSFRRDLLGKDPTYVGEILLHELLHLSHAWQDIAIRQIISMLTSTAPKLEAAARDLWEMGDEQVVEYLARALYAVLPAPARGEVAS